jgi:glycosyltransferase involved in cell wall biosynthesis
MHDELPAPTVKRVLMTADAVGGVWTYALDLAGALRERAVAVTLAVMGPPMTPRQRSAAAARGIEIVEGPFRLEWMDGADEDFDASAAWLLNVVRECRADVVHLNGCWHAALPWPVPVLAVVHSCVRTWWRGVHGEDAPQAWTQYGRRVEAGLDAATMVAAPTFALLADVKREYRFAAPCTVIPNGSASAGAPQPDVHKEPFVFSAGRLWDEAKNIGALCDIAPSLRWPVYVAGDVDGPTGRFTPSGAVRHLGQLDAAAVANWYGRASIYALPARYEPFGLSVLEAAAAGCALVLGDIATLRENWRDAAVFVPPDNRRALAAALEHLCRDPRRRDDLSRAARTRASQFTVDRMADRYRAAYAELVALVGTA